MSGEVIEVLGQTVITDSDSDILEVGQNIISTVEVGYTSGNVTGVSSVNGVTGDVITFDDVLFTNQTSVVITHNLGRYPSVTVLDSFNDLVWADIVYNSVNQLTVNFTAPSSGTVVCN